VENNFADVAPGYDFLQRSGGIMQGMDGRDYRAKLSFPKHFQ
jgi:hypothetical protein